MTSTGNSRFNVALYRWALALLACVAVLGLVRPLMTLGRFIPLDPNEGWNAYFGAKAVEGGPLYSPADSLITNNYPPLSFYIVGGVGHLTGDNIFAGRVIALLSLLFVSWSIYFWLRMSGSASRIALLGGAAFLAYAVTYGRDYVAMDDPQWLAHAIMMSGLLVLWKGKDSARHIIAAAVLMMAGGWTKHLLLPLPLAATLWLLWRSRPAFAIWAVCSAVLLAAACLLAWWAYGGNFFTSLSAPRQYSGHKAMVATVGALKCFAPLLGLWVITWLRGRFSERAGFISLYLLISGVIGVAVAGGAGVDANSFFDVMISANLAAALAVELLGSRPAASAGPVAALLLAICILGYALSLAPLQIERIRNVARLEQSALEDIRVIATEGRGRAACEVPGLCYWARNRTFLVDFFYFGQKLRTGILPASACASIFDGGGIRLLQLDSTPNIRAELLPEDCNRTINSRYRQIRESRFGTLMAPVDTPSSDSL